MHQRAARRVGRGAHHFLRCLGSFAAILILLVGFALWRLMDGPITLDWLAPYLEAAFERSGVGFKVTIAGVQLGLDPTTHHLDLRAHDVRMALPDGALLARFPEISTAFGIGALMQGQLVPAQLIIERPVVHLARERSGAITARLAGPDDTATDLGPKVLEQLAGGRHSDEPLGELQRLAIRGASVIVDDEQSGQTWRTDRVDMAVERSGKGIRGDFALAGPAGPNKPELHAQYRYFADRHVLDLELAIDGIEPNAIPPLIPELLQLQHLRLPVSGTLHTRIELDQARAQGSRLDLTLGKGQVQSELLPQGVVDIEKGELHATYAPERSEVQLESLTLDLGGDTVLVLDGSIGGVTPELIAAARDARPGDHVKGKLNANLKRVPPDGLAPLWPYALSPGARRWVLANVRDGVIDEASAQLSLDIDPAGHTADLLDAQGTLRYRGLTVTYIDGLPPARQVDGIAKFADGHLVFLPSSGVVKGLKTTGGTLDISEIGSPLEWLTIDLPVNGSLQEALELIDSKPLYYARAANLDPARVGGHTDAVLHFRFPLLAALKLDQIEYSAKATMTGVSIAKIAMDRNLTDGAIALELARAGAHAQGTARVDGIPIKLDATVPFRVRGGPRAIYRIGMTLDVEARRRLGLDFDARLTGPVGVDVTYSRFEAARAQAVANLDLRAASLAIDEAGWKKAPDTPGAAKLVIELDHDRITQLSDVEVKSAGLDGRLAVAVSEDGKQVERVDIRRMIAGDNDFSGTVTRHPGGGWHADIHAVRIDGRKLIKEAASGSGPASPIPLAVTARIDRLILGPRQEIGQITGELLRRGGIWQSARLDGRLPNGHKLALRLGDAASRQFDFETDDLGATLKLLGVADNVVGGRLAINGQLSSSPDAQTMQGHIEGANYSVARAPVMARVLALPSFTGILSMLSGDGLPFGTLRGDFTLSSGRVTIKNLLAFGEALGITASGWVDTERNRLELAGTVAPAYALNSLLGNIPLLGQLLVGGSQGMFAANYHLSGSTDDPDVSVNPLSVLTPGILRQLFAPVVGFPAPQAEQQAVSPPAQPADAAAAR